METYQFQVELEVRDYECDFQGVVNNAVYQNYLEHANHEFLKRMGVDTVALGQTGVYLMIKRIEMNYLYPLRAGERFAVYLRMERVSRLRYGFQQNIFRLPDGRPILQAYLTATGVNSLGRPELPEPVEAKLRPWCRLTGHLRPPQSEPDADWERRAG